MKNDRKSVVVHAVALIFCLASAYTGAESTTGAAPVGNTLSATARLRLTVVIPRFLSFRIGSRGETIDTLSFEPPPDKVGNGSVVSATGGDAAAGSGARVNLRSNAGEITLTATNDGGIGGLGSRGAVSLADISTLSDTPELAAPALTDAGGSTSRTSVTGGNVTDLAATWRYQYRNLHAVDPGTYRAEIIYTAASP
ncbi:MAG: hypothetical protein WCH04_04300 [Gammaproteobacteria bacterium]